MIKKQYPWRQKDFYNEVSIVFEGDKQPKAAVGHETMIIETKPDQNNNHEEKTRF